MASSPRQDGPFWQDGYTVMEGLLEPGQVAMAAMAMDVSQREGWISTSDDVALADDEYSPVLGELYLRDCRERVESVIGRPLKETYAFWRVYHAGAQLEPHHDRESCEVTVSVTIACEHPDQGWPFGLRDLRDKTTLIDLPPGDAIIFQGHEIEHWREELRGGRHKQLFLHYVFADGEFADQALDGRTTDPLGRKIIGESQ